MIWSDKELEFLRTRLVLSTKEIYEAFVEEYGSARSYDSVQSKVKRLQDAFGPEDQYSDEEIEQKLSTILATPEDSKLSQPLASSTKVEMKEQRIEFLTNIIENTSQFKLPKTASPVKSKKSSLVMVLSDTHCGQQNKLFGLKEFTERLLDYPDQVYALNSGKEIDEVIINLVGDIVEGEDIYPTQPHHVVCPTIEQIEIATDTLWRLTLKAKALFKCPVRLVCVPGNHGRVSQTANEKTNWDNVVYHCLKLLIGNTKEKDISIEHNGEQFKTFKVKDKIGLLYHQGVKHTGTPAMREKIAGWVNSKKCDFIVSGHFHEWKVGSWHNATIISNGSLCGPNDLSERMAQNTPARQGFFLVTPDRPLNNFGYAEWTTDEIPFNEEVDE